MFGIGFSELLIVSVIALLVLGPERLPKAARFVGLWIRRGRAQWYSVKAELENELASEELRRTLSEPMREVEAVSRETQLSMNEAARAARDATAVPNDPGAVGSVAPALAVPSKSAAAASSSDKPAETPSPDQPNPSA